MKKFKYGVGACTDSFDSRLFQLIVLLKPDFNCSRRFALSWVNKVTTGTWRFVSVIPNIASFVSFGNTHLLEQVKMRLIYQLIIGISGVLQKLLRYFKITNISTSFVPPSSALSAIFCLNVNAAMLLAAWILAVALVSVQVGSSP